MASATCPFGTRYGTYGTRTRHRYIGCLVTLALALAVAGCAPQYAIRQPPAPVESPNIVALERKISEIQAQELTRNHRLVDPSYATLRGVRIPAVLSRLVAVSERPHLRYVVYIIEDRDPNAAALADGRVFITTGMLEYLAARGARQDELAFILAHELAHTCAQHLVKRLQQVQWTEALTELAGAAASGIASSGSGVTQAAAQRAGQVGSLVGNVAGNMYVAGYSQGQELEADQLGARYCVRAGFNPWAGVALLEDFRRFDIHGLYLSTHPYSERRASDLTRFLQAQTIPGTAVPGTSVPGTARVSAPLSLRLERISWDALMPSARRTVINGRSVKMGEFVDGAQVVLIEERRVKLFKDGREFWLELP